MIELFFLSRRIGADTIVFFFWHEVKQKDMDEG
jgi:hypothetical protein